ncbi:MAG TPA: hypothetical protein VHO72_02965 [Bacteroidales bacterium]|nr:hypothetical protein [Bacteroidales bacterium]
MKRKDRKAVQNNINVDHRGNINRVTRIYNLEMELVNNINKQTPSYAFDEKSK